MIVSIFSSKTDWFIYSTLKQLVLLIMWYVCKEQCLSSIVNYNVILNSISLMQLKNSTFTKAWVDLTAVARKCNSPDMDSNSAVWLMLIHEGWLGGRCLIRGAVQHFASPQVNRWKAPAFSIVLGLLIKRTPTRFYWSNHVYWHCWKVPNIRMIIINGSSVASDFLTMSLLD